MRKILIWIRYLVYRYFVYRKYKNNNLANKIILKKINFNNNVNFFGYYNICPQNYNNEIIFNSISFEKTRGSVFSDSDIILFSNEVYHKINTTKAWNWQQGAMLQWYGKDKNNIILNDYENGTYISKIISKKGEVVQKYLKPIYSLSSCGGYALTLSFERLAEMRPDYGYFNHNNAMTLPHDKDGIWKINLKSGKNKLIISIKQLIDLNYVESMKGAKHKVNHIDINPSGDRFMFLHRWIGPLGRFTRLITANCSGNDICILNGDKMTSHCCWMNNQKILSFCYHEGKDKNGYFYFFDKTSKVEFASNEMPDEDGHPSLSPNGKYVIVDTYPDKSRMSYLYLYNIAENKKHYIGNFFQPLKYKGEIRVDLHPKWGLNSESIFFESAHLGKREFYKIDLSKWIYEKENFNN